MKFKVTTSSPDYENGAEQVNIFDFKETQDVEDYGNGIYIMVTQDGKKWKYIDCRYIGNYSFEKVCLEVLLGHYGKNLKRWERL